ncbi:MAG: MFS transporter [Chloroflexota bacterium]
MLRFTSVIKIRSAQIRQQGWFPTATSAMVLALAGLGDTLLYPTLPLYASQLGVPIIWVGVLLSINKLIRLGGNHALALSISRLGYKRVATLGVLLASASTLAYGMHPPIWVWLLSRMAWGLAFAGLRLCALGYATDTNQQGFHLGLSKAIKEFGPMSALFIGPLLINHINVHIAFQIFGIVTLAALPLTWLLPGETKTSKPKMKGTVARPTWFDGLIFATALADGVVVVTIGLLLLYAGISEITILSLSAFFLAIKRLSVTVFGPVSGWLADKWGIKNLFLISVFGFFVGLVLISAGVIVGGITTLFVSTAINQTLAAGVALSLSENTKLNTLSTLTTWRDLGTAIGALLGGYLLVLSEPNVVYGILAVIVFSFGFKVARLPSLEPDHR